MPSAGPGLRQLDADPAWPCIDCLSDLHLSPAMPATQARLLAHMQSTPAAAICLLGDVFEVWVGDDAVGHDDFLRGTLAGLRQAAGHRPLFFMHGNRDFLLGPAACDLAGMALLHDPCLLVFHNKRFLLSHGDALCVDDRAYQDFRLQVRSTAWQNNFLSQSLADRLAHAQHLRAQSEAQKQHRPASAWADADPQMASQWLQQWQAQTLIHGHTHRPGNHALPDGGVRWVLSDWDLDAPAPDQHRGDMLRIHADGRIARQQMRQ